MSNAIRRGRPRKYTVGQVVHGFEILEYLGAKYGGSQYRVRHLACGNVVDLWTQNIERGSRSHGCEKCPRARQNPFWKHWQTVQRRGSRFPSLKVFAAEIGECRDSSWMIVADNDLLGLGPGNWKWVLRRDTRPARAPLVEVCGVSHSQSRWADICGVSRERIRQRLRDRSPCMAILQYPTAVEYVAQHTGMGLEEVRALSWPGSLVDARTGSQ